MSITERLLHFEAEQAVSPDRAEQYEEQADRYWDTFYRSNHTHFYKDRHYLQRECSHLLTSGITVLEVGCGVGNTAFPVLQQNESARLYACDFSPHAIKLLKQNPLYDNERIRADVTDISCKSPFGFLGQTKIDLCTMVFVLSAIHPHKLQQVVRNVAAVLRPGGRVYVRDYAQGDLAQQRLSSSSRAQKLAGDFYLRMDGTRAHYFTQAVLEELFAAESFACEAMTIIERRVENRLQQVTMHRRWIQATFMLQHTSRDTDHPSRPAPSSGQMQAGSSACDCSGSMHAQDELAACSATNTADPRADTSEQRHASAAAGRHEWEEDSSLETEETGWGLGSLFDDGSAVQLERQEVRLAGWGPGQVLQVLAAPRELQHSLAHTGLLLWQGSRALAQLILACPCAFAGKRLLEVGCGASPLVSLAALRHCRSVTATDGSRTALQLLQRNLCLNASFVVIERMHVALLPWGPGEQLQMHTRRHPAGFDVVVGADVVYSPDFVEPLMRTVAAVLARSSNALFVLVYIPRGVNQVDVFISPAQIQ